MGSSNEGYPFQKEKRRPTIWISILAIHSLTPHKETLNLSDSIIATYYPHFRIPAGTTEKALLHGLALDEYTLQVKPTYFQSPLAYESKKIRYGPKVGKESSGLFLHIEPEQTVCVCYNYGFTKKYQDILVSDDCVFLYPTNYDYKLLGLTFAIANLFLADCISVMKGESYYGGTIDGTFLLGSVLNPPRRPRNLPLSTNVR